MIIQNKVPSAIAALLLAFQVFNADGMQQQRTQPLPLVNLGATCYMNSALQLMAAMKDLNELIGPLSALYAPQSIGRDYIEFINYPFIEKPMEAPAICHLSLQKKFPHGGIRDTSGKLVTPAAQVEDDADDYATWLLEQLSEKSFQNLKDPKALAGHAAIDNLTKAETTEVITGTHPVTQKKSVLSKNSIPRGTLLLGIPSKEARTLKPGGSLPLQLALEKYLEDLSYDKLPEDYRYDYDVNVDGKEIKKSAIVADAYKTVSLEKLPQYLFINLMRKREGYRDVTPVSFPLYNFPIKTAAGAYFYDVLGFASHSGSASSGHWIAHIKHGNRWFRCSDTSCRPVEKDEIEEIARTGIAGGSIPTLLLFQKAQFEPIPKKAVRKKVKKRITAQEAKKIVADSQAAEVDYQDAAMKLNHLFVIRKKFQNDLAQQSTKTSAIYQEMEKMEAIIKTQEFIAGEAASTEMVTEGTQSADYFKKAADQERKTLEDLYKERAEKSNAAEMEQKQLVSESKKLITLDEKIAHARTELQKQKTKWQKASARAKKLRKVESQKKNN